MFTPGTLLALGLAGVSPVAARQSQRLNGVRTAHFLDRDLWMKASSIESLKPLGSGRLQPARPLLTHRLINDATFIST